MTFEPKPATDAEIQECREWLPLREDNEFSADFAEQLIARIDADAKRIEAAKAVIAAMALADLIAALEKAVGPSRELDAKIYAQFGTIDEAHCNSWRHMDGRTDLTRAHFIAAWAPDYTASIDAALSLVPEGIEEVRIHINWAAGACSAALDFDTFDGNRLEIACAKTPAIALCIAALKARTDRSAE